MESYTLNICGRNEGPLFQDRTVTTTTGPILTVTNKPALHDTKGRSLGFVQLAYDKRGHQIAAGDNIGNVYIFDFRKKRFWRICNLGIYCSTSLAFIPSVRHDLIIATSNCVITLWNSEFCTHKKSITIHKNCVQNISVNDSGTRALTSSTEEAIMWDLTSGFNMLFKLKDGKDVNILKAFFIPTFDYIACAFRTSFVYLWDSSTRKFKTNFACCEDGSLWLKTIEVSEDGKIIACGGKSDLMFIWNVETSSFLHKISFAKYLNSIFQIILLSNHRLNKNIISILDQNGHLHLYHIESQNYILCLTVDDGKIISVSECDNKLAVITSSGALKLYDINSLLAEPTKYHPKPPPVVAKTCPKTEVKKKLKGCTTEFDVKGLKEYFFTLKEYPASNRNFIWSHLLNLPRNDEFLNFYDDKYEYSLLGTKYDNLNKSLKGTFVRQLSMLVQWCPFLKEVNYIPDLTFPFVSQLRNTLHMCFELLITLISNWCRNWFSYIPFPPYNILYSVENLLVFHDRLLLHHFMQHNISSEVYAFSLLRSSFSDVFVKDQWLKLWDNIFSNSPAFVIFLVVAFNIMSREILFQCKTPDDFKVFYTQKSVLVSHVIDEAYRLEQSTPVCFDPSPIIGSFSPLPQNGYPPLTRFTHLKTDFQTLTHEEILENEMNHWQSVFEKSSAVCNLEEAKKLMDIRRDLLLQSLDQKNTDELKNIDTKVKRVQKLIKENLIPQEDIILRPVVVDEQVPKESQSPQCLRTIKDILQLREKLAQNDI